MIRSLCVYYTHIARVGQTRTSAEAPRDPTTGTQLSPAVELAWGLRAPARSGPKPTFSLDQIVTEGVQLADELGLAKFSMNKLAASLNSPTMSLYRYVPGKDDLLTLMLDAGYGPIPAKAPSPTPWRAGLEFWARSLSTIYRTHPWMLDVPISGLPMTPNALQWIDYGLQSLGDTGLDEDDQLSALLLLDGHVRSSARLANDLQDAGGERGPAPPFSETMSQLVHEERYPALSRLIASRAIDSSSETDPAGFEFGLARVLDGIEDITPSATRTVQRDR
jgi:AcrR family transcriptional regulator